MNKPRLFVPLIILAWFGCNSGEHQPATLEPREIASPSAPGSAEPNLVAAPDGGVYLSWLNVSEDRTAALRFAKHDGEAWSEPGTVAQGQNWFVNWADFPSLLALSDNWLVAHWLAKSGPGTYAYNVYLAQSLDGGQTWSEPVVPHTDGTETEHGFVSLLPWPNDRLGVVWLDGRNFAQGKHEMTVRFAALDRSGRLSDEAVLDSRTCECCQTSAALTAEGAIVAYRDRSENEVRDIGVVRWVNGQWTEPRILHADNWTFHACPVNGPAVAADGHNVAIAWFTAAHDTPKVQIAFSEDSGATFGAPIRLSEGETLGRVDALLLPDGSALVSWMESTDTAAEIRVCRVQRDGRIDLTTTLAAISAGRASGFPRMARSGNQVYFAWTQVGEPSTVRVAVAELPHELTRPATDGVSLAD